MTDPSLPPVVRSAVIARPRQEVFSIFTDEIGAWWPLPTHSVFQGEAGGVHFVDGRLLERGIDGREALWAEVLELSPPDRLVLAWHPGRPDGPAGRVEVTFTDEAGATRVQIRHDGWEAFGEQALEQRRSYTGPSAWGHVLDHFADGAEPRTDGADLGEVEAAYRAFFSEARQGGFGPASDDEWSADQVIAHVALNDLALTAVAHGLIHGTDPAFSNHGCQERPALDSLVSACGDVDTLISFGRRCADQHLGALRRLDPDQRTQLVPCRFEDGGELRMEGDMPWGRIAIEIQGANHLPGHTEQLRALRP